MISIGVVRLSIHEMHMCQAELIECRLSTANSSKNPMPDEQPACRGLKHKVKAAYFAHADQL